MRLRIPHHILKALFHNVFQALDHFRFLPEEPHPVLHPLEVARRHPARVGQNIRHHKDPLLRQYLVSHRGRRPVRALHHNPRSNLVRVPARNHVLRRRRNQNLALAQQHLFARHRLRVLEAQRRPVPLLVPQQLMYVDPVRVVQAALVLGDADHLVSLVRHQPRRIRAHIPKALNHHPATLPRHLQVAQALVADHHHAPPGRLLAPA